MGTLPFLTRISVHIISFLLFFVRWALRLLPIRRSSWQQHFFVFLSSCFHSYSLPAFETISCGVSFASSSFIASFGAAADCVFMTLGSNSAYFSSRGRSHRFLETIFLLFSLEESLFLMPGHRTCAATDLRPLPMWIAPLCFRIRAASSALFVTQDTVDQKVACLSGLFLNVVFSATFPCIITHCFNQSLRLFESSSVFCPTLLRSDPSPGASCALKSPATFVVLLAAVLM